MEGYVLCPRIRVERLLHVQTLKLHSVTPINLLSHCLGQYDSLRPNCTQPPPLFLIGLVMGRGQREPHRGVWLNITPHEH